jgi:spore photoproduct lyase
MEDVNLWEPVFGRSYPSNDAFEQDMIQAYRKKIHAIHHNRRRSDLFLDGRQGLSIRDFFFI